MKKIKEYISSYKWVKPLIILVGVISLVLYSVSLRNQKIEAEQRLKVAQHNEKVALDSIRVTKDREGKAEYDKLAYLTKSIKDLQKLNEELAKEVKGIKGNVNTIIKSDVKVVEKEVPFIVKGELVDSTVTAFFNYDSTYSPGNYKRLAGYTQYNLKDGTTVAKKITDEVGISFTVGIKNKEEGKPEIFLRSDYPNFTVTKLDGAVLDPALFSNKKKTPLITPTISVGWTPLRFDNKEQVVRVTPKDVGVTVGAGFNIFKLLGIKK